MIEQLLLKSDSFEGVREAGGFGQPLHALYPQIRAVLASELEPDAALLLAEPVVDRARNRIDWYTQGDPDHQPAALSELPDEERRSILARVEELLGRGRELAERYAASDDSRRMQLGAILRTVLAAPAETELFRVDGRPVVTGWGFAPDRPWEAPDGSARPPTPSKGSTEPARDVAVPEIAIPELAMAAPKSAPAAESPLETERQVEPFPPPPEPVAEPSEPSAGAARTGSEPPAKLESPSVATGLEPPPTPGSAPASPLRYVVVGSRYFWSVAAIALLLALFAAYWGLGRERSLPIADETARSTADLEPGGALTQAQRTEAELRIRLEQLLVRLAGQRGQCPLPTGANAPTVVPAAGGADVAGTIPTPSAGGERLSPVIPAGSGGRREPDAPVSAPDRVAVPSASPGRESGGAPVEVARTESTSPERGVPIPATQPSPTGAVKPPEAAGPPPTTSESPPPASVEPPARTLEEALTGGDSALVASLRQQPPVKVEPTPEERREFADRMSETGATTGEITVTLLWNTQGDLDLVVRCPSGRQLDFRNPAECGGTLDVDANISRGSLSDRPVENAFWPAGKAGPGAYEIAVRYVPRKDEERLLETPFQVRLSRGGQESVFKGVVRPNAVTPVTTFTVRR